MKQYRSYIIGVIILVVSLVGFIYSFFTLIDTKDIVQAIGDVSLELAITFSLLMFLSGVGWFMHQWSLRQQRPKRRPTNLKLRLRMQRGEYPKTSNTESWWVDFWQGISTEMYGAVVTGFFLGMVVLVFQQYSAIQNRQADLILQMRSPNNDFATEAVRQLRAEGWLEDGTLTDTGFGNADLTGANLLYANLTGVYFARTNLTNANLHNANLTGADLREANLTNANLLNANLQDTFWHGANLTRSYLRTTNLTGANLSNTRLTYAYLRFADLTDAELEFTNLSYSYLWSANLTNANLHNANLTGADLREANLTEVKFNVRSTLPDGTNWTEDTDMERFTDPEHPDYWHPCNEVTPRPWYCD